MWLYFPALEGLRQVNCHELEASLVNTEFQASLDYSVRSCIKQNKTNEMKQQTENTLFWLIFFLDCLHQPYQVCIIFLMKESRKKLIFFTHKICINFSK